MNAPAPFQSLNITLPEDGLHLNGELYFSVAQVANHLKVDKQTLYQRCIEGQMAYIVQPGTKKKKLIAGSELRRFLMYSQEKR